MSDYKYEPLTTLVELRTKKGYTREKLSELSGISLATIKALELGINNPKEAKLSTLLAICKALKIKLKKLFPEETSL